MCHKLAAPAAMLIPILFLCACVADHRCSYPKGKVVDTLAVPKVPGSDMVMRKFDSTKAESIYTLQERILITRSNRGAVTAIGTNLVSEAVTVVKTIITNEQGKYTASTPFTQSGLYFYDQPSLTGAFDPSGMQFTGLELVKLCRSDTAFIATFSLDTSRMTEVLNNAQFNLKMTGFRLKYVKPKVAAGGSHKMSVQIDLTFMTAFVAGTGVLMDSVVLGKFHVLLNDISIDPKDPAFGRWPEGKPFPEVSGKSFTVPRSLGYFKHGTALVQGYNQGMYTILASVKECTKPSFADRVLSENSTWIISAASSGVSSELNKTPTPAKK